MDKPYSPSCDRNREPILAVLRDHFGTHHDVLEIGSGTGQHAVHFAAAMPWLRWQCSDVADNLPGIRMWLDEAALPNTPAPIELDVARGPWPTQTFDARRTELDVRVQIPQDLLLRGQDLKRDSAAAGLGNISLVVGGDFRVQKDRRRPTTLVGTVTTVRGSYEY